MIFDHNKIFGVHHINISLIFLLKSQLVTTGPQLATQLVLTGDTAGPHWRGHQLAPVRTSCVASENQLGRQ